MPAIHSTTARQRRSVPPIVERLRTLFDAIPDDELLATLRGPKRRGRPGYDQEILWRCFMTYYALGIESVSALLRLLRDNPFIADACGIGDQMPSQPTLSRFGSKLSKRWNALEVKNVFRKLTLMLYEVLPDYGKSVAIDSTDVKGWSNANKKGRRKFNVRGPGHPRRQGKVSDPDAGWCVKTNTEGNKKYVWGYKVHILADTTYELPMAVSITAGNVHDVNEAKPLLRQARVAYGQFHPQYVLCDAGYSSDPLRQHIRRQYRAEPVIDPNPAHKRAVKRTPKTADWKAVYNRRTAIERLNGRLKGFYKLNDIRVRGRMKVTLHATLSALVTLANAVAFPATPRCRMA
jgi:IS5 family transposase